MATSPETDCDEAWEMAYLDCEHYVHGVPTSGWARPACLSIDECASALVPAECKPPQPDPGR